MAQAQLGTVNPLGYGANLGGLLGGVRLYPASNVVAMPLASGQLVAELQLRIPDNYADVWFTPGSGQFTEDQDYTDQGVAYRQKVQMEVPRDAPDVGAALSVLTSVRYFLAVVTDHNGITRLAGDVNWPLQLTLGHDSGKGLRDRNAHQLLLSGSTVAPAPYYQHLEIPAGRRRVFSAGFTFGFQRT